jgi:hypothetical protein
MTLTPLFPVVLTTLDGGWMEQDEPFKRVPILKNANWQDIVKDRAGLQQFQHTAAQQKALAQRKQSLQPHLKFIADPVKRKEFELTDADKQILGSSSSNSDGAAATADQEAGDGDTDAADAGAVEVPPPAAARSDDLVQANSILSLLKELMQAQKGNGRFVVELPKVRRASKPKEAARSTAVAVVAAAAAGAGASAAEPSPANIQQPVIAPVPTEPTVAMPTTTPVSAAAAALESASSRAAPNPIVTVPAAETTADDDELNDDDVEEYNRHHQAPSIFSRFDESVAEITAATDGRPYATRNRRGPTETAAQRAT